MLRGRYEDWRGGSLVLSVCLELVMIDRALSEVEVLMSARELPAPYNFSAFAISIQGYRLKSECTYILQCKSIIQAKRLHRITKDVGMFP